MCCSHWRRVTSLTQIAPTTCHLCTSFVGYFCHPPRFHFTTLSLRLNPLATAIPTIIRPPRFQNPCLVNLMKTRAGPRTLYKPDKEAWLESYFDEYLALVSDKLREFAAHKRFRDE